MNPFLWVLLILFGAALLVLGLSYKNLRDQCNTEKQFKNSLQDEIKHYIDNEQSNSQKIEQLLSYIQELDEERLRQTKRTHELENQLSADINLTRVKEELSSLNSIVDDTTNHIKRLNTETQLKTDQLTSLIAACQASQGRLNEMRAQVDALDAQKKIYTDELVRLQEIKRRSIIEDADLKLFTLDLMPKESRIIELIQGLKAECTELSEDLSNIEWKKVWLPKMQSLCKAMNADVRGIYRLVSKADNRVCYIGQAVNIKERWYQHVKKMVGVTGRGNERLYDYRPDELLWEIVEYGDNVDLNSSEKYWIEYYAAVEVGLNRKI